MAGNARYSPRLFSMLGDHINDGIIQRGIPVVAPSFPPKESIQFWTLANL
jgi:hypothetical protein